ncbi:ATP-binding cassette domain-containing protein [Clavibacter michiganensis]|uniref:ATP-binding cassette domain-containing protein n=2 Tax=Clavibacter michiganensis TaxID=28447 RepID=UPI00142D9E4D|nr:ABC transporter ATP-binding protein [Clavibacter michiganensis]MDO4126312.1 ABC transporter ATP-binding protein [Clavibacter michiganensis]NIY59849.1 ATP-binding cassette domain-containing protein [Clavibacter michiganensis subsp. michiganensis]QXP03711.1 ABC transporter ATP-binding protein [Clavibacter michiganensis subsp. michiganensis]QXP06741.1 ABC transporter ATP-binding protein [Clavibacter michiganensis subsp. michiganensis]
MHPALDVRSLSIAIDRVPLVHDVDLRVGAGERVALVGASGSGKSLTAQAVLGTLPPGSRVRGVVELGGRAVGASAPRQRLGRVAAVQQDSLAALNPLVTVGAQLVAALRASRARGSAADGGLLTRGDARREVVALLAEVGIEDPDGTLPAFAAELSGGQRQRVCLALALLCRAELLLADEPTTALDVVTQARVVDVIRRRLDATGQALLFITHDLAVAAALCDRVVVLEAGRVVEAGSMRELVRRPRHAYSRALVAAASRRAGGGSADRVAAAASASAPLGAVAAR